MNEPLERTPENIEALDAKWGRSAMRDWVLIEYEPPPLLIPQDRPRGQKQRLYRNYSFADMRGIWEHWPEPCGIRAATMEEIAADDSRISPEGSNAADGGFASVHRLAAIPDKAPDQGQKEQKPDETAKSGWFEKRLLAMKGRGAAIKGGWEDFWEATGEYMVSWGYFWSLVRLAAVYWTSSHECAFSVVQSIFLTVLWTFAIEARHLRRVAAKQFVPFSFSIRPNYRSILTDAGLLANDPEGNERSWQLLIEAQAEGEIPWSGTECQVIDYNSDSDKHVIAYQHSYASFANPHPRESRRYFYGSVLAFGFGRFDLEALPLGKAFPAGCHAGNARLNAGFWAEPRGAGMHVLVDIDQEWWAARWANSKDAKPVFLREDVQSWEGIVQLTVAVIPFTELQCFYHWIPRWGIVSARHRNRAMEALGWHADRVDHRGVADYSHKYVNVAHGPLNG